VTVKYARAVGGLWSADATWSTTSNGAADTTKPTAADEAILDASSGNVNVDTGSCVARSLDCDTYTGTLTTNASSSLTLGDGTAPTGGRVLRVGSGMTWTGGGFGTNISSTAGAGTVTITTNGKALTAASFLFNGGGTYHLADAINVGTGTLTISSGTFVTNNFAITCGSFNSSSSSPRTLTLGSSAIAVTANTGFVATTITSLTVTANTAVMTLSGATAAFSSGVKDWNGLTVVYGTSSSTRTFAGGGCTIGTLTYTVAGSTGQLTITGQNTFGTINFSDVTNARTLAMPTSSGTTVTGTFNVNGTSGKLMTVTGDLTKASGTVSCDYLSISNSDAAGGATFYAGANSTNGGSNTGWVFTAPPSATGATGDGAARSLNRLAGTTGLDAQGAANVWAGTVGLDLVGALNAKAGTVGLEYNGVCRRLASQLSGNAELDAQGALASIP
jgi:hypothetical protein